MPTSAIAPCQSQVALSEQDLASRVATEKLTANSVDVGFTAPYEGIRSTASVAEAKTRLSATRAKCERLEEPADAAHRRYPSDSGRYPHQQTEPDLTGYQSQAFRHRHSEPRPHAAPRHPRRGTTAWRPHAADIGLAEADRYPRLTLNGELGYTVNGTPGSGALSFGTWSFGPSLSLPIFDGGRRAASVRLAQSKYDEALADFKSRARRCHP